jgi:hypothetical protein
MHLANVIKDTQHIPVLVINGAVGGTSIRQHQRNSEESEDLSTRDG